MITAVTLSYYTENRQKEEVCVGVGNPVAVSYTAGTRESAILYGERLLENYSKGVFM